MFSQLGLTEEDIEVDPQLGYPPVYAKLCRHAYTAGFPMPFTEGPPQRFLPYSPEAEDFVTFKEWDNLFPIVVEKEREPPNTRKYAEELWQQLDHLGNAGFDPAKFRVDPYGNVVYWNADPSSPLAWDVDHWFPHPPLLCRRGKTKLANLRIVQWQAYLRKKSRLEFLVPWWDLQHGCSINQFLSAFAAKNADFRGEDESVAREHVGECRPWPQQFREKKALCGLAAAAIVSVPKEYEEAEIRVCDSLKGSPSRRHWSIEEEEALKRGVSKFGPGSWKEIKEYDPTLANRSAVQIKDKFRLMRGTSRNSGRENNGASSTATGRNDLLERQSAATTALQKELRIKIMREEDRREREEDLAQLEETVMKLKLENEKERMKALELEALLRKHKHRVEKHRKWAESQSSYRLCLERVLRDTMHQSISYKEQARLNQEACHVLIARLDCQKATCDAAEKDLLVRHSQREILEAAAGGKTNDRTTIVHRGLVTQGRDIVDVSSCVSLRAIEEEEDEEEEDEEEEDEEEEKVVLTGNDLTESDSEDEGEDEVYSLRREHQQAARKSLVRHAIKVAMQVEDTRREVELSPWEMPVEAKSPCRLTVSEYTTEPAQTARESDEISLMHKQYDADSETPESESESDFADDEMSPEFRNPEEDCKNDNIDVSAMAQFDEGQSVEYREDCTRKSKPDETDLGNIAFTFEHGQSPVPELVFDFPIPSAGESRPDTKQEVQKDVIMVQPDSSRARAALDTLDNAAVYKQEYLDELLRQIRFQIPATEVAGETIEDDHPNISEGHLDDLLDQVLATHLNNIRRSDGRQKQSSETDDEKLKQMGKSNLDKWLQVLLFKDTGSACSSPGHDSQTHSPALSQISEAAIRGTLEFAREQDYISKGGDNGERSKGLWRALLRKLSLKHQSEHSLLTKPIEESEVDEAQISPKANHDEDISDAMKSLLKTPPHDEGFQQMGGILAEGRHCDSEACTIPGWPGGFHLGLTPGYWPKENKTSEKTLVTDATTIWKAERMVEDSMIGHAFDQPYSIERRYFPRPLSDVDEISETESLDNQSLNFQMPESKDINRPKRRVSIKVAGLVWKKAVRKLETKLQDGSAAPAHIG